MAGTGPAVRLSGHGGTVPEPAVPVHRAVYHPAGLYRRPAGNAAHGPAVDHDLSDGLHRPDGYRRQQRHRLCGLHQPAPPGRHGAPRGPHRHRQDPYAPHPHDHPDHGAGHAPDGPEQRYGWTADARHVRRHHLRPELRHPDDPVHRPVDVRHPLQEAAAQRGYRQRGRPGRHPG